MSKRELTDKIKGFAEECAADSARHSQVTASILFGLAGALAADNEEALMERVCRFAQGEVNRLSASRN